MVFEEKKTTARQDRTEDAEMDIRELNRKRDRKIGNRKRGRIIGNRKRDRKIGNWKRDKKERKLELQRVELG